MDTKLDKIEVALGIGLEGGERVAGGRGGGRRGSRGGRRKEEEDLFST